LNVALRQCIKNCEAAGAVASNKLGMKSRLGFGLGIVAVLQNSLAQLGIVQLVPRVYAATVLVYIIFRNIPSKETMTKVTFIANRRHELAMKCFRAKWVCDRTIMPRSSIAFTISEMIQVLRVRPLLAIPLDCFRLTLVLLCMAPSQSGPCHGKLQPAGRSQTWPCCLIPICRR